jgi:ring-1,2-phenylacetyl-CoA epoxidase subunit PaaE
MGLFNKIFGGKKDEVKTHKGYHLLKVKNNTKLTSDSAQISFEIPSELKSKFNYKPGQYITLLAEINGKEERRSYSICSGINEDLAVGIKRVEKGVFSNWAIDNLSEGIEISVSEPQGNFVWENTSKFVVAFVAGSGITPVLSIAKTIENEVADMRIFYGNKSKQSTMFYDEFAKLSNAKVKFAFSQEQDNDAIQGRLTKETISEIIKSDLNLLKADAFYLCGPEELIVNAKEVLEMFGVAKTKIHFELFTSPVLIKTEEKSIDKTLFKGDTEIQVILDQEKIELKYNNEKKTVLEALNDEGYDPPYSCRGGVCCSCKAKVLEGDMMMKMNYSLTDKEVAEGYVLTCQAYSTTQKVTLSYDA